MSVQATATWADDVATCRRVWDLFRSTPPPLGYDPASFWPGGWEDPGFGLLRLEPTMVELAAMAGVPGRRRRWRAPPAGS